MKKPMVLCLAAIAATAPLAIAGGGGEKERAEAKQVRDDTDRRTLERLAGMEASAVAAAPGEGFSFAVGDDLTVRIGHRIQLLFTHTDNDDGGSAGPDSDSFRIRRARMGFSGNLWDPSMTYKLQLNLLGSSNNAVLDAWIDWAFREAENGDVIGLRVGRQKPHHGREFTGSSAKLEHTNRSLASRVFSGQRILAAFLHGKHLEDGRLQWWAGIGNNDPATASSAEEARTGPNRDNVLNSYFDVHLDPFGDAGEGSYTQADLGYSEQPKGTLGTSLMLGNHQPTGVASTLTQGAKVRTVSLDFYTAWHYQGWSFLSEAFVRSDKSEFEARKADSQGYAIGGGYVLQPPEEGSSQWAVAGRWSMADQDDGPILMNSGRFADLGDVLGVGNVGHIKEFQGTITCYHNGNKMKSQLSYRYQESSPEGLTTTDTQFLELMFQWVF